MFNLYSKIIKLFKYSNFANSEYFSRSQLNLLKEDFVNLSNLFQHHIFIDDDREAEQNKGVDNISN